MKKTIVVATAALVVAMLFMLGTILYLYVLVNNDNGTDKTATETQTENEEDDEFFAERPGESDESVEASNENFYVGELELPIDGATGYAPIRTNVLVSADRNADTVVTLQPGEAFLILQEQGEWWEVSVGDETGWVRNTTCMINLPDVIPSIRYNCTNTYNSKFVMPGAVIPGITGEMLYPGETFNERLGKNEYIAAVMYPMSKKIWKVQQAAHEAGDCLVIYETFRPYSVQRKVASAMSALMATNYELERMITSGGWSLTWFISTGVSNHQKGGAMDVGLLELSGNEEYATAGEYSYLQTGTPDYYDMPTPIHELSVNAVTFTYPVNSESYNAWLSAKLSQGMIDKPAAQTLQKYCTDAGLTPLASEWWHFNDLELLNSLQGNYGGDFILEDCLSVPPRSSIPLEVDSDE